MGVQPFDQTPTRTLNDVYVMRVIMTLGVEDGIRTHDTWNHNPVL